MSHESEQKPRDRESNCYSVGERAGMALWQNVRAATLRPLLQILAHVGVRPDHLTLLSAVVGLGFCPLFFWSKPLAFAMLAVHVLLDGLDGPLARHTKMESRQGSFSDSMADQLVVVASTITLMSIRVVGVLPGSIYIVSYTVVLLFAMVRNALSIPYSWLVRPRFFVYIWLVVETYYLPGTIGYILWFFNAVLAMKLLTGFGQIRRRI